MGSLAGTIMRRLLLGLPTLAGVVIVSFVLTRLLPGDPAVYFAGAAPTAEAIADLRKVLLLDRPLWDQFATYLSQLAHGNLGRSLVTGQPVVKDLASRFPATLELTAAALALALLVALPLGIAGALRKGHAVDHLSRLVSTTALSMPSFFTGLLLVFLFYYLAGIAPAPLGRINPMAFPPPDRTGFLPDQFGAGRRLVGLAECTRASRAPGDHARAGRDRAAGARHAGRHARRAEQRFHPSRPLL